MHIEIRDSAINKIGVVILRQNIVSALGKAAGTNSTATIVVTGYRGKVARVLRCSQHKDDFLAVYINTLRMAYSADVIVIPFVIHRPLEIRFIRRFAARAGIGDIAAGHAGTAVARRRHIGIAIRAGVISVRSQRGELVLLDAALCKDHLLAVRGRQQASECILARGLQCLAADRTGNRPLGHIVLAGGIHLVLAQLAVGARLSVRIQHLAVILDRLHREGLLRGLHRQVHTGIIVVRDRFYILLALMEGIALAAEVAADIVHNAAAAILSLLYAADHGIGAGIGVIVTAEYEVEARLFDGGEDLRRCGNGLGTVDRLVSHKHPPDAVSLQRLGDVRKSRSQLRSVVDNHNANLATLHLVPTILGAFGQVVERTADLTVCVAVVLMVAHDMDHVHTAESLAVDRV